MTKPSADLVPLNIIRTETVLSKLPIHNLARQGQVNIQIAKHNERGQTELYWEVSANEKYGLPGHLAYKIDTIIINRRIDELGRPLPTIIRLGTLRAMCTELGLHLSGKNLADIKTAILQNVGALITAKLNYKGNDGTKRRLEAVFNRYSVVFTGETLPNGKKADAVYLVLNEPYLEVLNNAPFRPLDYDYLRSLPPLAQRFYEILSYRMFVAIKYNNAEASLRYSEYCTLSAQNRHYDYDHFKKQMYKIYKPHLTSGYIEKVSYKETVDDNGQPDWVMVYIPGPRAKAEYQFFNGGQLMAGENKRQEQSNTQAKAQTKQTAQHTPAAIETVSSTSVHKNAAALQLVQYFHKLARHKDNYQPSSRELTQADQIVASHGLDKAKLIVAFAVAEGKKTSFAMRTFGAVLHYVNDASEHIAQSERREKEPVHQELPREADQADELEALMNGFPADQAKAMYDQAKAQMSIDLPQIKINENSSSFRELVKEEILWQLAKQAKNSEHR